MRATIEPVPIRLRERCDVAPIGFHPPSARSIHQRVVRISDHHLVAKTLQMLSDPFAAATTLHQDSHRCPAGEDRRQALPRRRDSTFEYDRTVRLDDPNLAFLGVQVDGTILHGWLLLCALSAFTLVEPTLPPRISQPLHLVMFDSGRGDVGVDEPQDVRPVRCPPRVCALPSQPARRTNVDRP